MRPRVARDLRTIANVTRRVDGKNLMRSTLALAIESLRSRTLLQKVLGNTFWLLSEKVLRSAVNLFVGVWVARYLGPANFGLLSFAIAFVALISPVADCGLQSVVVRDLIRRPDCRPQIIASAVTVRLIGAAIAVVLSLGSVVLIRPDDSTSFIAALAIALSFFPQAWDIIDFDYQARMQPRPIVVIRIASLIVFSIVKIAMIENDAHVTWFAWVITGEAALSAALMWLLSTAQPPAFRFSAATSSEMKHLLQNSWPLAVSSLSVMLYMRIDQVMLGQMLDDKAVGIFSAAVRISESWYFVPMTILAAVSPALTAAHQRSEKEYREKLMLVMRTVFWLAVALAIILSTTSGQLITLLFGEGYSESGAVLAVHAWAGIFASLGVASSPWFVNAGLLKLRMTYTLVGAATNMVINVYAIYHFGVVGAAVATLVSYCFAGFLMNAVSARSRPVFLLQLRALMFR